MHTLPWGRQHWIILRQVQGWLYLYKGIRELWRFPKLHWMGCIRLQYSETAFLIELYDTWWFWICNIEWGFQKEMDRKRNWEVQTCWITRVNSKNCLKGVDPDHQKSQFKWESIVALSAVQREITDNIVSPDTRIREYSVLHLLKFLVLFQIFSISSRYSMIFFRNH